MAGSSEALELLTARARAAQEAAVSAAIAIGGPEAPLLIAEGSYVRLAAELEALTKLQPEDMSLACNKGCRWCCYPGKLEISVPEAVAIAAHIEARFEAASRRRVEERLDRSAQGARELDPMERWRQRRPCPLLDEEAGACSVYAVRPVACRGWNSIDAARCEELWHHRDRVVPIPSNLVQHRLAQQHMEGQDAAVARAGRDARRTDLATVVLAVLREPTIKESWARVEQQAP